MITIEASNRTQQHPTKITTEKYDADLKRIDELLPLVTDDTPNKDPNLIELLKVSDNVEEYQDVHYPIPDNGN